MGVKAPAKAPGAVGLPIIGAMNRRPACFLAACLALASGCTPALDWREVRLGDVALALFPCKPETATRRVALDGQELSLTLQACTAAGMRFAVARADVRDPARVGPVLAALAQAQARNLQAALPPGEPVQLPGMTPHAQSRRYMLQGRRPDGSAVQAQLLVFTRGTQVLQATVLDAPPDAAAARTFLDALHAPR